jgi:hypothetical protein
MCFEGGVSMRACVPSVWMIPETVFSGGELWGCFREYVIHGAFLPGDVCLGGGKEVLRGCFMKINYLRWSKMEGVGFLFFSFS